MLNIEWFLSMLGNFPNLKCDWLEPPVYNWWKISEILNIFIIGFYH